jgi:transcriptional regulator with XRE-family HTH domain
MLLADRQEPMIGDRIRTLRESRGWTQAHLAEVAGVSERTIQRVETQHSYSGETAMALASALNVEVQDLVAPNAAAAGEHRPLWPAPKPHGAAVAALILTTPGMLMIGANTLQYTGVTAVPMAGLETIGHFLGLVPRFWYLWPLPLIAAPVAGILLVVAALIRVHGSVERGSLTATGVELRWHPLAALALLLCLGTMFAPTANIVGDMIARAAHAPLD